jgi:hypothetical protein
MNALSVPLRRQLECAILAARTAAETGARKALRSLGVDTETPPQHLSEEQRELHRRLRAQAHMLGDGKDLKHLIEKVAYDHWHRLLFSRFLVENHMLLHPEHRVALEIADLAELASEEDIREPWDLAARYTAAVLPGVFRPDDPVGALLLPSEDRGELLRSLKELPAEVFQADDSLGWVYQFWRAEEKDAVNKAGEKIDADTLPAVTQLFTEHYMVEFLLHNTLGAWWTAKVEAAGCTSTIPLPYLRRKDNGSPAAGAFPGWPKSVRELRVIDPCCGSGHFLVALLQLLVAMLCEEEKLRVEEAARVVLGEMLHGLEIDARCTQLAAFNVALAAWKLIGRPVELPPLRIACSGLSVGATREQWLSAVEDKDARFLIGQLYDLFKKAPELGSLINPARLSNIGKKASDLLPYARQLLACDPLANPEQHELGVTAKGLAEAVEVLGATFTLVSTNVPYLGRGRQGEILAEHCADHYPDAKADLATCFLERCLAYTSNEGACALVLPQNWFFLAGFKKLRRRLLESTRWNFVARLGEKGFESTAAAGAFTALLSLSRSIAPQDHSMMGLDVANLKTPAEKAAGLRRSDSIWISQFGQLQNPDSIITLGEASQSSLLSEFASSYAGICTGDYPRFGRMFWEIPHQTPQWDFQGSTVLSSALWEGRECILRWDGGNGPLLEFVRARLGPNNAGSWIRGKDCWGRNGIAVSLMRKLPARAYSGELFDDNVAVLIPKEERFLLPILTYCCSPAFNDEVRRINQKVALKTQYLVKVPFDLAHWQRVATEKYPKGLPKPHSDDPTQWLFDGHPRGSLHPLQVAVARLLGYRWPRQTSSEFPDCPALGPDGLEAFEDGDGIICLNAIKGETPAADRVQSLLATAYESEWSAEKLSELLAHSGARSLEDWSRNYFFEDHCAVFHQRPFLWQIWDGRKDGFSAIVNYHRLDRPTLEKLTYAHLGDWLRRQEAAKQAGEAGSDARYQAALELQAKLKLIIEGEPPYDIFVRWKPIEKQPVGWEPDLNDGVRLNIRPFVTAGVLRRNPKINWRKDRGKDVPSAPWFSVFKGERINDHHLTVEEKVAARAPGEKKAAAAAIA